MRRITSAFILIAAMAVPLGPAGPAIGQLYRGAQADPVTGVAGVQGVARRLSSTGVRGRWITRKP